MKRIYVSSGLFLAIITVMLLVTACGGTKPTSTNTSTNTEKAKVVTLKLGHMSPETSPYNVLAKKFIELVEQRTNGSVKIELFPAGQLGKDKELLEAMQSGTLDLGVITTSPMVNFVPEMGVLDLPYVFKDWDHVEKYLASPTLTEIMKESQKAKLVTMSMLPRGFRNVTNSKRPIEKPADLKDLKLRVIESPVYVDSFKAMGANAQAMSWGEVFTALQQKTIDGQENAINTIYDERLYEVQKYVSETSHMFAFAAVVAGKGSYDKLPPDVQKIMHDAALEAAKAVGKQQREEEALFKKKLQDKGMTFNDADREAFRQMVKPVHDNFATKQGDKYLKQLNALR